MDGIAGQPRSQGFSLKKWVRSRAVRLRIILAFHMALIYYTQDFRVYEETRDQPMPGPFPAPPIFEGKALGTRLDRGTEFGFPGLVFFVKMYKK